MAVTKDDVLMAEAVKLANEVILLRRDLLKKENHLRSLVNTLAKNYKAEPEDKSREVIL